MLEGRRREARRGGRGWGAGVLGVVLSLALAGCAQVPVVFDRTPVPEATMAPQPPAYSGTITCVGSSVLAPVLAAAGERFRQAYPLAHILVITTTSQSGLSAVQDGGADLGLSDVTARAFSGMDAEALHDYPVAGAIYALIAHPAVGLTGLTPDQVQRSLHRARAQLAGAGRGQTRGPRGQPPERGRRALLFRQTSCRVSGRRHDCHAAGYRPGRGGAGRGAPGAIGYVSLSAVRAGGAGADPERRAAHRAQRARLGRYTFWGVGPSLHQRPGGRPGPDLYRLPADPRRADRIIQSAGVHPRLRSPITGSP